MIKVLLLIYVISLPSSYAKSIRIMSYNVENLFDTVHDQGKNDYEFLPKISKVKNKGCQTLSRWRKKSCLRVDWTEQKLAAKIEQIKKVVEHANYPEILALIEVENENVVGKLAKILAYDGVIVSNGLDGRGVDVALLYKTKKLPFVFKKFKQHNTKKTRSILEVIFTKKEKSYHFFVNHWPSQGSPATTRYKVANKLAGIIGLMGENDGSIVMGDFNTIDSDRPHPIEDALLKKTNLTDLSIFLDRKKSPPGTYFYPKKMSWNFFDRIFVSKNLVKKAKSFSIISPPFLTGVFEYKRKGEPLFGSRIVGIPKRYNFKSTKSRKLGFSDHFAVMTELTGL
jgi:hypothetical protein